ncbi:MAG: CRTAC1 family protein [Planctomycetes bacterium]|nr:CRTAC1 family protein [Planctomycetota bacterium]
MFACIRLRPGLKALWLLAAPFVAGCNREAEPSQRPPAPPAHQRMLDVLAAEARRGASDNPFFGKATLERLHAEFGQRGAAAPWQLRLELGTEELRAGHERDGIKILADARWALQRGTIPGDAQAAVAISFQLATGWLRLAETENCCAQPTQDTCILPLRGSAIHSRREGAERAAELFVEVLRNTAPDDHWHYAARWLLNVAHMALGDHPDGVPAEHRIPAEHFAPEAPFPRLLDVAPATGLDTWGCAGGVLLEDFDGDEHLDVLASDWHPSGQLRLFRNQRDGTFAEVTERAGLFGLTGGLQLVCADYDNDGDRDVLVLRGAWSFEFGQVPNSLLQNRGDGTFTDVTFAAGLAEPALPTQTAAFLDFDRDGWLDLYVGNEHSPRQTAPSQLFRNNRDGTFTDVAAAAGVANHAYAKGVAAGDFDADGWPDLYVSNIDGPNRLYHNRGNGTFVDVAPRLGVTAPHAGFPTWFFDYDNDGALDLFAANYDTGIGHLASHLLGGSLHWEHLRVYRGDGKGGFRDVTATLGLAMPALPMGSGFGDLDNDGFPDFYLGTGDPNYYSLMPNLLFRNEGGQRFTNVTMASGTGHLQKGHGVAFADLDGDGDQDLFCVVGGAVPGDAFRNVLFENPGFGNHWLAVRLVGQESPRDGLGARLCAVVREGGHERRVYAQVGPGGSFAGSPLRVHLGLGRAEQLERLEVRWPKTGQLQVVTGLSLDRAVRVVEGQEGFTTLDLQPVPFRRK